jgi:gamma-glutamyltranspeptidase/glutathione hydrolase/leukotriene-C4 hydrolase
MGLGGGFLMTIYLRATKQAITLNAREAAPANASEDTYHRDPQLARRGQFVLIKYRGHN